MTEHHVKLAVYDPAAHPGEELTEIDPAVALPEGTVLAPGVKVYLRSPNPPDPGPFDCTECPDDPRPHTHSPWGGLHKVYEDERTRG